jgi:lysophospholipase
MDLHPTPDNPLPPGAVAVPVKTRDGFVLRALTATGQEPRGTVVVLGGRGDFMERYFETMRDLMARGYAVASLDVRGQGGSQRLLPNPYRNHIRSFSEFDEDLRAFMTEVVLPACPPPYFALAHSTGGNILLRSLVSHKWFSRAVVTSPLIGLLYGGWPLTAVRLLLALTAILGLGRLFLPGMRRKPLGRKDFPGNPLTADERRWNRDSAVLEAHPELGSGAPTFSWLRAARRSTARLKAMNARTRLSCPVLIVAAGLERVVDNEAIRRFAKRVPGVSLVFIGESRHEILSEGDAIRAQLFAAFDAFLEPDAKG